MEYGLGIWIPLLGTAFGAASVICMKQAMQGKLMNWLLGLASGVMVAASVWSLIIPSMEMASDWGRWSFVPATIGFLIGVFMLYGLDKVFKGQNIEETCNSERNDTINDKWNHTMLLLAITLHNIPEGMAVGVAFAGAMSSDIDMNFLSAWVLAIGIAIQNIPEGAVVALPLWAKGYSKRKAFCYGVLSGVVEPVAAGVTVLVASVITVILPYLLAYAAGAMIYVVLEELLPEAIGSREKSESMWGFVIGFLFMMILDVALG